MADKQLGNVHNITTPGNDVGVIDSDMTTIAAAKARLTAIDANAYSAENLAHMTYNDMVYALRVHDHPSTINS